MLSRLFGALAVAVGVGAVVAVKLLKDQKETENKEVEDDNEVHFYNLVRWRWSSTAYLRRK